MISHQRLHGSCASRNGEAVLVIGPSGSGKSDLVLRLLSHSFELVADDQVDVAHGMASCPTELAGLLEVRGVGIVRLPYRAAARLVLVVELDGPLERMPYPNQHPKLGVPVIRIDATAASATDKVILALNCALGLVSQVSGVFAP